MKIAIKIEHDTYLILTAAELAAILPHLEDRRFYEKEGYRDDSKYKEKDYRPHIEIVPDHLIEQSLPAMVTTALKAQSK